MSITRYFTRTISFARPANVTAYTANDAVSDDATTPTVATFTLSGMAPDDAAGGVITNVALHKSAESLTNADFDVYFFDAPPVAAGWNDNAALAITDAEWKTYIGRAFLDESAQGNSVVTGATIEAPNLDMHYQCAADDNKLYVVLVARGAYTPASAEVFTLRVSGRVD